MRKTLELLPEPRDFRVTIACRSCSDDELAYVELVPGVWCWVSRPRTV